MIDVQLEEHAGRNSYWIVLSFILEEDIINGSTLS